MKEVATVDYQDKVNEIQSLAFGEVRQPSKWKHKLSALCGSSWMLTSCVWHCSFSYRFSEIKSLFSINNSKENVSQNIAGNV